ncbi:MAG: hypothetical protein RL591_965, partial [Planctomycetota bacterium]
MAAAAVAVSLTLAGGVVGCAATTSTPRTPSVAQSDEIEPVNAELPPPKPRRTPERVVFSDETDPSDGDETDASAFASGFGDGGGEPTGLVEQLAASYDDDMKALAAMQANRTKSNSAPAAATETRPPAKEPPDFADARTANSPATQPPTQPPTQPTTTPATTSTPAPTTTPVTTPATTPATTATVPPPAPTTTTPTQQPANRIEPSAPAEPASATVAKSADTTTAQSASAATTVMQANASLELPPAVAPVPTEPAELAKLLGEALARKGGESAHPMREWISFAALAITDPNLALPKDFGADLLPAERERIEKA